MNNENSTTNLSIEEKERLRRHRKNTRLNLRMKIGFKKLALNPCLLTIAIANALIAGWFLSIRNEFTSNEALDAYLSILGHDVTVLYLVVLVCTMLNLFISILVIIFIGTPSTANKRELQLMESGFINPLTDNVFLIEEKRNYAIFTLAFYSTKSVEQWLESQNTIFHNLELAPTKKDPIQSKGKIITLRGKKIKEKKNNGEGVKDVDF
jgi:hypothetical protein